MHTLHLFVVTTESTIKPRTYYIAQVLQYQAPPLACDTTTIMMTTKTSTSPFFLAALLLLALSSSSTMVTAFAPSIGNNVVSTSSLTSNNNNNNNKQTTRTTTTRIFAAPAKKSIVEAEDMYLELATKSEGVLEKPDVIYMIVYNPSTNEEGIHTMKYPRGSDTEGELLITFEGLADCIEFSRVIKDDPGMQHEPVPTPTQTAMMENACKDMNLPMKIVPMEEQKK